MNRKSKPVYLYDIKGNFIKKFETTKECGDYFNQDRDYINHSLAYYKKIRKDGKWYVISREEHGKQ